MGAPAWFRVVALVLAVLGAAALGGGPAGAAPGLEGADLLLLQVRVGSHLLPDAVLPVYASAAGYGVPLGQFARTLSLAVSVDARAGKAEGFVLREERRFSLDLAEGVVRVGRRRFRLDPGQVTREGDDLYVDSRLLARWFPVELEVDLLEAELRVRSREPLPVEQRREREARIERLRSRPKPKPARFPRMDNPYALWSGPSVEQSLTLNLAGGGPAYSTYLFGDVLTLNGVLYFSGDTQDPLRASRITLGRKDPEPVLLGSLGAREFSLGYVFQPGLPLVSRGRGGIGVSVSRFPLEAPTEYTTTDFEGVLPEGWDVELYRNGVLIDARLAGEGDEPGLYRFLDVPLTYGDNVFRLVFYGPQGQQRVEVRRVNVGHSLVPPGDVYYRAAVLEDPEGRRHSLLRSDFPLSAGWTGRVAVAEVPLPDRPATYLRGGVATALGGVFAHSDLTLETGGGSATEVGVQTRLGPLTLDLDRVWLRDFQSEVFNGPEPVVGQTVLRLGGPLLSPGLPFTLDAAWNERLSGERDAEIASRVSGRYGRITLSNRLEWAVGAGRRAHGTLSFTGPLGRNWLRAELNYGVVPEVDGRSVGLTLSRELGRYRLHASAQHALDTGRSGLSVGWTHDGASHALGLNVAYQLDGSVSGGLTVGFSLGRDPRRGGWIVGRPGEGRQGTVSALVFVDNNGNGRQDPGEPPLEAAGLLVNGRRAGRTGPDGIALLSGLSTDRLSSVAVDLATLPDPFLAPAVEGISLFPHAGAPVRVEFPVVHTAELLGTVYVARDGVRTAAGGVELELVDASGRVVEKTTSLIGGLFELPHIRPGRYVLRPAPAQLARFGVDPQPGVALEVPAGGGTLNGIELVIDGGGTGPLQAPSGLARASSS